MLPTSIYLFQFGMRRDLRPSLLGIGDSPPKTNSLSVLASPAFLLRGIRALTYRKKVWAFCFSGSRIRCSECGRCPNPVLIIKWIRSRDCKWRNLKMDFFDLVQWVNRRWASSSEMPRVGCFLVKARQLKYDCKGVKSNLFCGARVWCGLRQAPSHLGRKTEVEVGFPRKPQNWLQWVHSQRTFNDY